MLRIYHNDQQALVVDDYHKTYKQMDKKEARSVSKAFLSETYWYASLENRRNYLISSGYRKIA